MRRPLQTEGPTRRGLLAAAAVAAMGLGACGDDGAKPARKEGFDPESVIDELTEGLSPDDSYRDPDAGERATARQAARVLAAGQAGTAEADRYFADLGMAAHDGTDP